VVTAIVQAQMTNDKENEMKLLTVKVHCVGGVKDVDFNLAGHNLFVVGGRNGTGKTSGIRAILMALCGREELRASWPDVPIPSGEEEGWVNVELGDDGAPGEEFLAQLHFSRKRDGSIYESFVLTDSSGKRKQGPRTLLRQLYSMRMFDPTRFERLRPSEQRDELVRLFPQLDFSDHDIRHAKLYEQRTEVNREGRALKARVEAMEMHADAPNEEVSVSQLMEELQRREHVNKTNGDERVALNRLRDELSTAMQQLNIARDELERLESQVAMRESVYHEKEAQVESLKDEDVTQVQRQIAESETVNSKVRDNRLRRECETRLKELATQSKSLTMEMDTIESEKQQSIRSAKLPVAGLGVDKEGVTYNGLPFEQSPRSKRFLIGCMIGMAGDRPKLPLLVCEHGDGLDWETLKQFDYMLKTNDWQAVIEVCTKSEDDDAKCQVVMELGEMKKQAVAVDRSTPARR
jgi:energy-coupling factor transporter ATP-binding protein EcfA2